MHYELRPFNIRVKIVEPGVIKTDFYSRSMTVLQNKTLTDYETYSQKVLNNLLSNGEKGSSPYGVAKTIYKAATDNRKKLHYPTGTSKEMVWIRKLLPFNVYCALIKNAIEK